MMQLKIQGDESIYNFINSYINKMMMSYIRSHIDIKRLVNYDIDKKQFLNVLFHKNYIRCQQIDGGYKLDINPSIILDNGQRFSDVCRLINFGNSSSPSYPIFDQMFMYFKRQIAVLMKYYSYRRD